MSRRFTIQHGNTDLFSLKLSFLSDPDPSGSVDRDMSASWGSFELWVDGRNLCQHVELDRQFDELCWFLLPLIEWFAENWDPLLHEMRLPNRNAAEDATRALAATMEPPGFMVGDAKASAEWEQAWFEWSQRHSLRTAAYGGLFPDLTIRRWHDQVEFSWREARPVGMPVHFRFIETDGVARIGVREVAEPLLNALRGACDHLISCSPRSERLLCLSRKLDSLSQTSYDVRLSWMVGLGRFASEILEGAGRLRGWLSSLPGFLDADDKPTYVAGSCQAAVMFGSASPALMEEDAIALARVALDASQSGRGQSELTRLQRHVPIEMGWRPHDAGYELAETLLEELDLPRDGQDSIDVYSIIRQLGVSVNDIELTDASIRGVAIVTRGGAAEIRINRRSRYNRFDVGKRFTAAHELCHILYDVEFGQPLGMVSGEWAPIDIEKRANAFAAMLLMPPKLLQRAHAACGGFNEVQKLVNAAKRMQCSPHSMIRHIENLNFISSENAERLRMELSYADMNAPA